MPWYKPSARHIKHSQEQPLARASAQHSLDAAAALPNSGLDFIDNSQGASAAVAELSRVLGDGICDVELDGDPTDALKSLLHTLTKTASNYDNAHAASLAGRIPWVCTPDVAAAIAVAFECASVVYEPGKWPGVEGFAHEHELHMMPSEDGSVKGTGFSRFWELDRDGVVNGREREGEGRRRRRRNPHFPALVVAVRGTGSKVDHIVNLNGEMRDARAFLGPKLTSLHAAKSDRPLVAHAGFLNGAAALLSEVTRRVDVVAAEETGPRHILFTGHSAGGAVASLLFAKFLAEAGGKYPTLQFSLITFGAPPVTSPSLTPLLLSRHIVPSSRGLALALVNAFDMVTRADTSYILSLVQLFKFAYGRDDGLAVDMVDVNPPRLPQLPFARSSVDGGGNSEELCRSRVWPMPKPDFWPLGRVVVMWEELERDGEGRGGGGEPEQEIRALAQKRRILRIEEVKPEEFVTALFCRIDVHKRDLYRRRIRLLAEGKFNMVEGWEA